MEISTYKHVVSYYETDMMGITHHSNYIRWMEEARVDFLAQIGWPYKKLEEMGIFSPVIGVTCDYRQPTTFSDEVSVKVSIKEYKGVKLLIEYEMTNKDGAAVCKGTSKHTFLDSEGKPVRMKRDYPEFFEALTSLVQSGEK